MGEVETIDIKIPNLGEAESTEIIEVNIKAGDKVNINDPLIVLESEKLQWRFHRTSMERLQRYM